MAIFRSKKGIAISKKYKERDEKQYFNNGIRQEKGLQTNFDENEKNRIFVYYIDKKNPCTKIGARTI